MSRLLHSVLLFLVPGTVLCQSDEFLHLELSWKTIETEHFLIHFHQGVERPAQEVAVIAEHIYGPITELYRHRPDQKVSIVLRDHDDYSNGAAYFYDNKIEIWVPALDFELRGTHPWLLNVVTHEFIHIVQIQTAMKLGRRFPALYFQWFGYEAERRPDVLYGFPNVLVSYPLSAFVVPSWFAEGTAQYNHPDFTYDFWDTHRDMILRMYMVEGNPLTWEEMAVFGKTSLGNESSYNAGFSIVKYIAERYGPDKLAEISRNLGSFHRLTIDGAIEAALGKSGKEVFEEWKRAMKNHYEVVMVGKEKTPGELIEGEGFGNFYPAFSRSGNLIAYVSNKGRDFFSQSSVYLYDLNGRTSERIRDGVRSTLSFSPDDRYLYYSRATQQNPNWSKVFDIYRFDLLNEKEERLTFGLRAMNPRISNDGTKIVFAYGSGGTLNIGTSDADGKNVRQLTSFADGEQVYTPVWSPDGTTAAFGFSSGEHQSVAVINDDGSGLRVVAEDADSRNPCFSPDGRRLYYSSDRTGIFNLYVVNLEEASTTQVTNILGGAFLPNVNERGDITYVSYTSSGYKIACLKSPVGIAGEKGHSHVDNAGSTPEEKTIDRTRTSRTALSQNPSGRFEARPYRNVFSSLSIIPLVRVDNYNPRNKGIDIVKAGLYVSSTDMLNKLSLFGGAAINRRFERDLFFILEYRDRLPLLFQLGLEPIVSLELYNISRKTSTSFRLDPSPQLITTDITYSLFEFDISFRQKVLSPDTEFRLWYSLSRYTADIGAFINPNTVPVTLVSAFRNLYLIGNTFTAQLKHRDIRPSVDSEINPVGRSINLRFASEINKFNPEGEFEVSDGLLVPVYQNLTFHKIDFQWDEHIPLPFERHTISMSIRRASTLGKNVDSFFDSYGGGFLGMKAYPFYALGGNDIGSLTLAYRFPLFRAINARILQFYFTKLYGSIFGDFGDAWTGSPPPLDQWKKGVGFELRLEAFSFYAYPTRFFFSGAYGFDRFTKTFSGIPVTYGREWRFYLGILFGFEISDLGRMHRWRLE